MNTHWEEVIVNSCQIKWWLHINSRLLFMFWLCGRFIASMKVRRCLTRLTWLVYLMSMIEGTERNHRGATIKITTLKAKIQTRDQQNRKRISITKCCNKVYVASVSSRSLLSRQTSASYQNLFYISIYLWPITDRILFMILMTFIWVYFTKFWGVSISFIWKSSQWP
jgi:hypothetical protein